MTIHSFTTTAREGDARAPGNLARLLAKKNRPAVTGRAEQVHGVAIAIVPKLTREKIYPKTDGLITAAPLQPIAIFTADCVPVFITAERTGVIGLLHAGWRGVQGGILKKAVHLLRKRWSLKPSEIRAWPGPFIGPCCFEVRWDVARYFPKTRCRRGQAWTVDLGEELRQQAADLGITWVKQKQAKGCTMHSKRYFSYRRDQTPSRQVSVILKS